MARSRDVVLGAARLFVIGLGRSVPTATLDQAPYLFLMPRKALPNRNLTEFALSPPSVSTGETDMSDFIFLALGCGTLLVLALYARALDRL